MQLGPMILTPASRARCDSRRSSSASSSRPVSEKRAVNSCRARAPLAAQSSTSSSTAVAGMQEMT